MTKKIGMIIALLGATAFFGSSAAYSSPKEPTNLMDYLKAKRDAAEKEKASGKSAKAGQTGGKGKKVAVKQRTSKKVLASAKRPIVETKARIKVTIRNRNLANVDTMTTASIPSSVGSIGSTKYSTIISSYAASYGVPVSLANAVVRVESNYRADMTGSAGEIGLMQIKLETARGLGYTGSRQALYNPETNIRWGMKYLAGAHKLGNGTTCGTILRYNAGHGATRMNPVSANYCAKVKMEMASN
ncbi:lytic transglycosylase domain-containing protein [Phyllobacterium sp. TAF24]|uniref:lytic transglycosylase domain-containing protein n=1 Tax=unclassified Phyllobacterium TaxID=2638441 RepID=UPI00088D625B|nr:transglycosylase SLT domain-containing protein [Phyllobacterium sp. OV277]SDO02196.1 Transglycosylase SLT domain-containing protein [Phyllobacterium sp. OV277]